MIQRHYRDNNLQKKDDNFLCMIVQKRGITDRLRSDAEGNSAEFAAAADRTALGSGRRHALQKPARVQSCMSIAPILNFFFVSFCCRRYKEFKAAGSTWEQTSSKVSIWSIRAHSPKLHMKRTECPAQWVPFICSDLLCCTQSLHL